ncbi:FlaD/FlaE family flagellar protein [Natrarchaeobius sp. A-rgal3]|uniref:FlaD/FlaE family flagellar protein n=1 Tax=Natrarchaeobius versutus TaxID=1679078 RepID=UPI00350F0FCA
MSGLLDEDELDDGDEEADDLLAGDGLMGDDELVGDDMDEGDDSDDELAYRLSEVEKEVDSLQNKVETVRGENEKISDSISSVEQNVDKLVDLYEIVTQGINPFVGDQEIGNAFENATDGGFGATDDPGDEIDEEISQASAEDFLDGDLEDEDDDDPFGEGLEAEDDDPLDDEFTDEDPLEGEDDDPLDDEFTDEDPLEGEDADPLEAEFADDDLPGEDNGAEDESEPDAGEQSPEEKLDEFLAPDEEAGPSADDPFGDEPDEAADDDPFADPDGNDELEGGGDTLESGRSDDSSDTLGTEASDDSRAEFAADGEAAALEDTVNGEIGEPPYLVRHPSRPDAEVLTLELIQYLVEEAGIDGAARTIAYYRSIGWISEPVESYFHRLLNGFGDGSTSIDGDPEPRSSLTTAEHKRCLEYVGAIATPEKQSTSLDSADRPFDRSEPTGANNSLGEGADESGFENAGSDRNAPEDPSEDEEGTVHHESGPVDVEEGDGMDPVDTVAAAEPQTDDDETASAPELEADDEAVPVAETEVDDDETVSAPELEVDPSVHVDESAGVSHPGDGDALESEEESGDETDEARRLE